MATKHAKVVVPLDRQSKTRLEKLCGKCGMTQIAMMSRIVNWFVRQDDTVQTMVLGSLSPESMAPLARKLLQRLADDKSGT
jgi:hypothetical protein